MGNRIDRKDIDQLLLDHPHNVRKATVIALIFKGSKIISVGYNRRKFSKHERLGYRFTWHAEISALLKAGKRARGCVMYVIRILKNGQIAKSLPCKICKVHIRRAGIVKVIDLYDELT
jgi:deoxycytidylate deaminase